MYTYTEVPVGLDISETDEPGVFEAQVSALTYGAANEPTDHEPLAVWLVKIGKHPEDPDGPNVMIGLRVPHKPFLYTYQEELMESAKEMMSEDAKQVVEMLVRHGWQPRAHVGDQSQQPGVLCLQRCDEFLVIHEDGRLETNQA